MATLIDIDLNVLNKYTEWENANKGNWTISSYLNQFYDVNAALAFTKFFFPTFIEKQGCVIIDFRYDEMIFNQWYDKFEGDVSLVEKYCNLYDVADYFHINQSSTEERQNILVEDLAKALTKVWQLNCNLLFPNKKLIVERFKEHGETCITIYSKATD
jgi:hypothetical protein